jgi:predicted nucleotidyltransferase
LKKIKRFSKKILDKKQRFFIFISFVKEDFGPQSDIDVLIFSGEIKGQKI